MVHSVITDFSPLLCVMWTGIPSAVLCSQPKRGALRRQDRIDQHNQEQLQDPWVRLSDSSPEELPEIHHHQCHRAADRTQAVNVHSKPATMSEEEITQELNGTAMDATSDPPSDMTPENTSETPPGAKKGPPVAPKPTWFRQSLRKIRDKPAEQRPSVSFSRSFGVRSASSAANLSIKQKIHSFETFSSPGGPEKGGNRRPVAASSSLPLMEKESRSHSASHGDYGRGKDEVPKEIQANQSAPVGETDSTTVTAKHSAITSSTFEAQTTAMSTEDEPPPSQSPTDIPLSDTTRTDLDSGIHGSVSAPVHDDSNALPSKQSELVREGLSRSTDTKVLPPTTSLRFSQAEGKSPPEGTEGDGAQHVSDSHPQRGLEGESLGKILTFSNQVCVM